MAIQAAGTAADYLARLSEDRRHAIAAVRETILSHLPEGYREEAGSMLLYVVPLSRYPNTYNKAPLQYLALASQKNHMALYMNAIYGDDVEDQRFREAYAASGKKLDMGKSCVRFRRLDDLALDVVAAAVARVPVDAFIAMYERSRTP